MNLTKVFTLLLFTSFISKAKSEYRVYQYIVKSKYPYNDNQSYTVTSTLDPVTYISYHGGEEAIEADMLNTWMCKGHTAKREPCASPSQLNDKTEQIEE